MAEHLNLVPIALLLVGAIAGGLLLAGLRQPPLVGYIFAGAVLGPSGIGLITDRRDRQPARRARRPGAAVRGRHAPVAARVSNIYQTALGAIALQIGVSVSLMLLLGPLSTGRARRAVLFGFVMALSSTVVGISMLEDVGELRSDRAGRGRRADRPGSRRGADADHRRRHLEQGGYRPRPLLLKLFAAVAALTGLIWLLSRRHRMRLPFRPLLLRYPDLAPIARAGPLRARRGVEQRAQLSPSWARSWPACMSATPPSAGSWCGR